MSKIRFILANIFLSVANFLYPKDGISRSPHFRPVDTYTEGIGHKYACGAYSYEHLKSLVEQDGPDGFGATATIKWLISEEGWVDTKDMTEHELSHLLAKSGILLELSPPTKENPHAN